MRRGAARDQGKEHRNLRLGDSGRIRGHRRGTVWGRGESGGQTLSLVGPLPRSPSSPRVALPCWCSPPVIRCSPSTSSGPMVCLPCSGPSLGPGPGSGSDSDPDSESTRGSRVGSTLRFEAPGAGSAPSPVPPPPFFTFMASRGLADPRLLPPPPQPALAGARGRGSVRRPTPGRAPGAVPP